MRCHNALRQFLATRCRNPVFWLVNTAMRCKKSQRVVTSSTPRCHNTLWPSWLAIFLQILQRVVDTLLCVVRCPQRVVRKVAMHCEFIFQAMHCRNPVSWLVNTAMHCEKSQHVLRYTLWPLWLASCKFYNALWIPRNPLWDTHNTLSENLQRVVSWFLATHCRNPVFWLVNTTMLCDILATYCDHSTRHCRKCMWGAHNTLFEN